MAKKKCPTQFEKWANIYLTALEKAMTDLEKPGRNSSPALTVMREAERHIMTLDAKKKNPCLYNFVIWLKAFLPELSDITPVGTSPQLIDRLTERPEWFKAKIKIKKFRIKYNLSVRKAE